MRFSTSSIILILGKKNLSEIIFRVFWQTHIADIKIQEGDETIVTYEYQGKILQDESWHLGKRLKEKFTTTIYKEHDNIYVVGKTFFTIYSYWKIITICL